jgi:hypothetical protein
MIFNRIESGVETVLRILSVVVFLFFLFTLLIQVLNVFTISESEYFHLYFVLISIYLLIIVGFSFTENILKGWLLFSLFYLFYLYPHFYQIFFYQDNLIIYNEIQSLKSGNIDYNINLIIKSLLLLFGINIGSFLWRKNRTILNLYGEVALIKLKRPIVVFLLIIALFLVFLNLINHSWSSITSGYTGGFSILFSAIYILNYLIVAWYIELLIKSQRKYLFGLTLGVLFLFLAFLGSRQMIFWVLLPIFLMYIFNYMAKFKKIPLLEIASFATIFMLLAGIIMHYRVYKSFNVVSFEFEDLINSAILAYLYETSYTIYNSFTSLELSLSGIDFFPLGNFLDLPIFLIPSFLFGGDKNDYLTVVQFKELYGIAPYNNYFILGELILSLRYSVLFLFFGVLYGWISEWMYNLFLAKIHLQKYMALYFVSVVYLYIFPIRGMLAVGLKLFLIFGVLLFLLFSMRIYKYKKI